MNHVTSSTSSKSDPAILEEAGGTVLGVPIRSDSPDPNLTDEAEAVRESAPTFPLVPPGVASLGSTGQTISQPKQPVGWAAVEEALSEFDKQEIGAYKDDLDSLLVFTGLYSAVLTAFVVLSYAQLQEDTASESLKVLRQISNQTAAGIALGGRPLNPNAVTSIPIPAPAFQPSLAAICVNGLWFASLVISLSTASFSIVVKQWLRAYLAFATASPQGQLRIREYRRRGLSKWLVFQIASLLPLVLQVSLALFFLGLCFFTIDVHPTIGGITLPFVCAWAFLFIAVTFAPIFSACCPYKTPFFAHAAAVLRGRIFSYLVSRSRGRVGSAIKTYTPEEEGDIMMQEDKDLDILVSADASQTDDRLLGAGITVALEQSNPTWIATITFLVRIIGNRIPGSMHDYNPVTHAPTIIDCSSLSRSALKAIANIFNVHVTTKLQATGQDTEAAQWVVCVFMSLAAQELDVQLSQDLSDLFFYHLDELVESSPQLWPSQRIIALSSLMILPVILQFTHNTDDVQRPLNELSAILHMATLRSSGTTTPSPPSSTDSDMEYDFELEGEQNEEYHPLVSVDPYFESRSDTTSQSSSIPSVGPAERAMRILLAETQRDILHGLSYEGAMLLSFKLCGIIAKHNEKAYLEYAMRQCRAMIKHAMRRLYSFRSKSSTTTILLELPRDPQFFDFMESYSCALFTSQEDNSFLASVIADIAEHHINSDGGQVLKLCYFALCLVREEKRAGSKWPQTGRYLRQWRVAFHLLAYALSVVSRHREIPRHDDICCRCWLAIEEIDGTSWVGFDHRKHPVPDYFCVVFGDAVRWRDEHVSWRGRFLYHEASQAHQRETRAEGEREVAKERAKRSRSQATTTLRTDAAASEDQLLQCM